MNVIAGKKQHERSRIGFTKALLSGATHGKTRGKWERIRSQEQVPEHQTACNSQKCH